MTTGELIREVQRIGVSLKPEQGRTVRAWNLALLPSELRTELKRRREEVYTCLTGAPAIESQPDPALATWRDVARRVVAGEFDTGSAPPRGSLLKSLLIGLRSQAEDPGVRAALLHLGHSPQEDPAEPPAAAPPSCDPYEPQRREESAARSRGYGRSYRSGD